MHSRLTARTIALLSLALWGCQKPTAVDFAVEAPTNALLDPFSLSVSDYVLKTRAGSIVAAVSAGASKDGRGRLPLGELAYTLSGDLRLDVMAGPQLVGRAHIEGVAVEKGKTDAWTAPVRKPLVAVGSASTPEDASGALAPPQLLDPTTNTDLQAGLKLPTSQTAAFTSDGTHLVLGAATGLYVVDTGSGVVVGPTALPFTPNLIAIAPGDAGLAFIERGASSSRVLWFHDVAGLVANPATATGDTLTVTTGFPRAAHFSPDGSTLYVLTEAAGDEPCTGATQPAANELVPITGGLVAAAIRMPSYVADFAVEPSGTLLLAEPVGNQIASLSLSTGAVATKLYDAKCPSAMKLVDDQLWAVTNDASVAGSFTLLHGHLDGTAPTRTPIVLPSYRTPLSASSTVDGKTTADLQLDPVAILAVELAVSPDGTNAVLATRARYREDARSGPFDFISFKCIAGVDVVEYGLYSVDLTIGTASYTSRSQTVIKSNANTLGDCVVCQNNEFGLELDVGCRSTSGDRAAGLAASFSEDQ